MATLDDIESYFKARADELRTISKNGTPWEFVCMSSFLEYLSKLVYGQDKHQQGYKDFITDYLAKVDSRYSTFHYKNGDTDLPVQMYHILRCGIVHAFSFVPDDASLRKGGRLRSIVLAHEASGNLHLSNYSSANAPDAAVFVSESFAVDIKSVVDYIFKQAATNPTLKTNIEIWYHQHPPITGNI